MVLAVVLVGRKQSRQDSVQEGSGRGRSGIVLGEGVRAMPEVVSSNFLNVLKAYNKLWHLCFDTTSVNLKVSGQSTNQLHSSYAPQVGMQIQHVLSPRYR